MEETELSKGVKKSGGDSNLKFSKLEPIQDGGADKLLQTVRGISQFQSVRFQGCVCIYHIYFQFNTT